MQTLTFANRLRNLRGGQGSLRRHLAQAAAGSAALALSSKLLVLLTSVLLARWMGAEGYGVYATAMALVLLLTVPTGLGLPTLVIRLIAGGRRPSVRPATTLRNPEWRDYHDEWERFKRNRNGAD